MNQCNRCDREILEDEYYCGVPDDETHTYEEWKAIRGGCGSCGYCMCCPCHKPDCEWCSQIDEGEG